MKYLKSLLISLLFLSTYLVCYEDNQLSSLYSGLDPESITQHIALYKLYPNLPTGKKALEHAQYLLKKCHSKKETLLKLPLITQSIDGFVSFMLGKEIKEDFLEDEYLEAIESISSELGNRKLKGYQIQSQEEIFALKPEDLDLGRAVLLAQQDPKNINWKWIRNYEAQLDFLALQVLARLSETPSPKEMIKKINQVLFFDLKYRFPNQYIQDEHHKFSQLSSVLDSKQGVCLGTSIVYLCLAQRLNLPLEIITPPGHIYVRYNDGEKITNIETTHRGIHVPCEAYMNVNVKHLKQVNLKQTICYIYHNLGTSSMMEGEFDKAIEFYSQSLKYDPSASLPNMMLGYAYAFNNQPKNAKKIFSKLKKIPFEDQITPLDYGASLDYLNGKVDLETLKAAILPSKEHNLDIIKEKRDILIKGLEKHPKFIAGWMMLSGIYSELCLPKKAIEALKHVDEINPNIPSVQFNLTVLYEESLNYPAAWDHFKKCESILAENKTHPKIMSQLKRALLSSSIEP